MGKIVADARLFEEKSVWKVLLKMAPPVMIARLIQGLYNIVDSFFIGRFSDDGLTALSIIFPLQLIVTALAVGTGVGVNTLMSRYYAHGETDEADRTAGTGTALAVISWAIFALISVLIMRPFVMTSTRSAQAVEYAVTYGNIVCVGSLGIFLESCWTKMHQSRGSMRIPMIAQIVGALTNILLDPLLIFGWKFIPAMGIAGAAYATVIGQVVAALITVSALRKPPKLKEMGSYAKQIYRLGYPSIVMQSLYTVYIAVLNMILAGFCDEAVTVLGLYYKLQTFFFIPLNGFQTCVVPFLSYVFAQKNYRRCREIISASTVLAMGLMLLGVASFLLIPKQLLGIFSNNALVFEIGIPAFRIIGLSFVPAVLSLMSPVFFQAIGHALSSVFLSLLRQIFCLMPIFWLLSLIGLEYTWFAFPLSESIAGIVGVLMLIKLMRKWNVFGKHAKEVSGTNMRMLTAIINRRDTGTVCEALTAAGFYYTRVATSGGLLSGGNTTLLLGVENSRMDAALDILRSQSTTRTEPVQSSDAQLPTHPDSVVVGGATVFIMELEQFRKI